MKPKHSVYLSAPFLKNLKEAFPLKPIPLQNFITDETGPEGNSVKEMLLGKQWDQIDFKTTSTLFSHLSLLTREAYRYYLPALMVGSMQNADKNLLGLLAISLSPVDTACGRLKSLSLSQRKIVFQFLKSNSEKNEDCKKCHLLWEEMALTDEDAISPDFLRNDDEPGTIKNTKQSLSTQQPASERTP